MTFETFFLAGVIAAFGSLALTLFTVTFLTRGGRRPVPATVVTPAKRPEAAAPRFDLAA